MALVGLDKQPTSWKTPHDWLVAFSSELATFCGINGTTKPQIAVQSGKPATTMATHHPYRGTCDTEEKHYLLGHRKQFLIGQAMANCMQGMLVSIHVCSKVL